MKSVRVSELTRPGTRLEAIAQWHTFVECAPASRCGPYGPAMQLAAQPDAEWAWSGGMPAVELAPIGCHFLQDVEVTGAGYLFGQGRFILEPTHTSLVALRRLGDLTFPDNPRVRPRPNRIEIAEPVLLVAGPGHDIFGHWLLDFLPRIEIAKRVLGPAMQHIKILLPSGTARWAEKMLLAYCDIGPEHLRYYNEAVEVVFCERVCLPSIGHNGHYAFHEMVRAFYQQVGARYENPETRARRICLSRRNFSLARSFENRDTFEALAVARGYELVRAEEYGFAEQAALFRSATCIVGEHGSGLHASVFAKPGTVVGSVGWNWIQPHICSTFDQTLVSMNRISRDAQQPGQPQSYTALESDLVGMFDRVERYLDGRTVPAATA